jgi:hypothetical protein
MHVYSVVTRGPKYQQLLCSFLSVCERKKREDLKEILSAVGTKPGNVSAPLFFNIIVNFSKAKQKSFFMKDLYFLEKT